MLILCFGIDPFETDVGRMLKVSFSDSSGKKRG